MVRTGRCGAPRSGWIVQRQESTERFLSLVTVGVDPWSSSTFDDLESLGLYLRRVVLGRHPTQQTESYRHMTPVLSLERSH
jgi:hypothetical protein